VERKGGSKKKREKKMSREAGTDWEKLAREVLSGMKDWKAQHPRATFAEIEEEIDEKVYEMRAKMLEDAVHWSEAVDVAAKQDGKRVNCNQCGGILQDRGKQRRKLRTQGNKQIELQRSYGYCPTCRVGFFPPG
jgi:RNase P subunit RPR2